MIRIAVVDSSAESRGRILDQLDSFLRSDLSEQQLLPRVNLKPISPQELKFNAAPDVCLIGPELVRSDMAEISRIKKLFPGTPLLVWLNQELSNLNTIEQVARQGADDVLTHDATPQYFFRRLLLLSRKAVHQSSGKLVLVDGGKGGVGVTTVVAAMAELATAAGKKVVVVDCDFETQDLSRFLQARPFVNENLRLLFDEERAVSEESVDQCLSPVWQDELALRCMAPVIDGDDLYDPRSRLPRTFLSVLEVLDSTNDLVIVDIGCARSTLQKMLYRVADKLIFVVNDDPASLYASVDKLTRARTQLSAGAQLCVVENCVGLSGLGNKLLRKEFSRAARLDANHWSPEPIPFCKLGQRWPGSGATFFSQAKAAASRAYEKLALALSVVEGSDAKRGLAKLFGRFSRNEQKSETPPLLPNGTQAIQAGYDSQFKNLLGHNGDARASAVVSPPRPKLIEHQRPHDNGFKVAANAEDLDLDSLVSVAKPR